MKIRVQVAGITNTFDPATGAKGASGKTLNWQVSSDLERRAFAKLNAETTTLPLTN